MKISAQTIEPLAEIIAGELVAILICGTSFYILLLGRR